MKIFERISSLRSALGLSREQFSGLVDISVNTLRAIETKERSPRSEVLEKISNQYPQLAAWLLIEEKVNDVRQENLDSFYTNREFTQIVALADARSMEKLPITSNCMSSLTLIQAIDDETTLSGLITLSEWPSPTNYPNKICVMIKSGNLNLFSDHRGKLALDTFRTWLRNNNQHLLESCTIRFAHEESIENAIASGEFEETIPHVALPHDDLIIEAKKRFEAWKHN